jgi:hypothetical protein
MRKTTAALGTLALGVLSLLAPKASESRGSGESLRGLPAATAAPLSENEKVEALIGIVEHLTDAVFVRNGDTHDAKAAASHLRKKWRGAGSQVKTARDFIRLCATQSSLSGQPYLIRWKNGRERRSADFLGEELDKLEGKRPRER